MLVIALKAEFYALAFKGAGVRLDLNVLLQQAINGLLCLFELHSGCRLCMELELLFYGLGQVPAEEHERVATVALWMQETPRFLVRGSQGISSTY